MPEPENVPVTQPREAERRAFADRIGTSLRRVFDDVAAEPIPDAFEDLLRQLR